VGPMNQRASSGLPLRAIVMVLLFLGVVFLLIAFNYLNSGDGGDDGKSGSASTSTVTPTTTPAASDEAAPRPEVRVYNVSEVQGAADRVAGTLRDQQWDARPENLALTEIPPATTVYWGPTPGEREAADEVGKVLDAPVAERGGELVDQPPGIIVVVTG
jgi:LytR cell envelope-related transcriptional attenuator